MLRYALTIFTSAFLLFQVQPLIGRFVLPWFGGGPSIWTTCMLFFQLLLLGGYLYSHVLSTWLNVRSQVVTHIAILALSLLFLPIIPSHAWKPLPDQSPSWQIFLLLLATVGGPYFMLSTTGPLLQRWFSRTSPGESPYRLYALSNLGSLLALLSYPFVFEPWMRLRHQAINWTVGYLVFAGLVVWCAVRLWKQMGHQSQESIDSATATNEETEEAKILAPRWWQMALWLGLSACGSVMLLATTNQLCIDVATVPFLWVLPLSLYLLTFILCFDSPRWYDRRIYGLMLLISMPAACWVLRQEADAAILDQIVIYSTVLFACCMACHGELAQSKPHPKYLTLFFVLISAGGAIGGLFVAIVAPQFFLGYWEYHIALTASVLLILSAWCSQRVWVGSPVPSFWILAIAIGVQIGSVGYFMYGPLAETLENHDRIVIFSVYAFIQIIGLALTVALERKVKPLCWVWIALAGLQLTWIVAYSQLHFSDDVTNRMYLGIALGAAIPTLVSVFALWFVTHRCSYSPQTSLRGLLSLAIGLFLATIWYFKWLDRWQVETMAVAFVVAWLAEAGVNWLRSPTGQSWGIWFWGPAGTLLVLLGMQLVDLVKDDDYDLAHMSRNFYGVLKVRFEEEADSEYAEFGGTYTLSHGQIVHGFQFTDDYWKRQPTTYYGYDSGIGHAIRLCTNLAKHTDQHAMRVGVVGLGTGSLAAYGKSGDHFRFYEINPEVLELSSEFFTYLNDSPADTQVKLGDARITMERELAASENQQFDVLAIDAFSSDAIPVHLLTTECGEIYRQHLRPGGILALHVSNRFLDLTPVARGLADSLGWRAYQVDSDDDDSLGVFGSNWILVTSSDTIADDEELAEVITPWDENDETISWTDDYSGLWRILSF